MKKMIPIKGSIFFICPDKSAITSAIGLGKFVSMRHVGSCFQTYSVTLNISPSCFSAG